MIVTRQINGERLVLFGWTRAILLQIAHPLIAAGVAQHSTFRGGPLAPLFRLHSTVRAMRAITFGDSQAQRIALSGIDAIHHRVHGALSEAVGLYPKGTRYSATDPALLLWVHATLLESVVLTYELLVGPLTPAEKNACCAESAWSAIELGADAAVVPQTWPALERYLASEHDSGRIVVGPDARALAASLLAPPGAWIAWPAIAMNRTLTIGLLPARVRDGYGWPWSADDERRFRRLVRRLARMRRWLPTGLAWWPERRQLVQAAGRKKKDPGRDTRQGLV
jgi:uncharacterized protein (DUF2236 family)